MAKKKKAERKELGWKPFLKFYTTFRIPWVYVIGTALFALAVKEVQVLIVPYQTKIMTGAITEGGFLAAFIVLNLASSLAETVQEGLIDMTRISFQRNVSRSVWGRLIRLPMPFFRRQEPQQLVSRMTKDTEGAVGFINCLVQLITIIFAIAEAFRRMYATYKMLSLIMLCGIPVVLLTGWLAGKLEYQVIFIQNKSISRLTNFFAERLPGLIHIKTSNTEEDEERRGIEENDRRYRAEIKAENRFIFIAPLTGLSNYVFEIILLVVAAGLVRAGQMEMFQLVNLYNYFLLFMGNTMMLVGIWQGIKSSQGANAVTATLMDTAEEDVETGIAMSEGNETISFEHVTFSYDGAKPVLQDVSFVIPKGKKTAIIGENGCGKSTILKLLEGFEQPTAGTIRIGEHRIDEIRKEDLRDHLGYLFQGNQVVAGTIRENICYGMERECSDEEVEEAARLANAYDFIHEKEAGLDTEISRFNQRVSGGEMQRIAVARMFLKKPQYLIMDEATSGIDAISQKAVMEAVDKMMKDKTVIMVSHNMDEIKSADHIVVLKDGMVEASGSYDEVYENSSLLRAFAGGLEE